MFRNPTRSGGLSLYGAGSARIIERDKSEDAFGDLLFGSVMSTTNPGINLDSN